MPDRSFYFQNDTDPVVAAYKKYIATVAKIYDPTIRDTSSIVSSIFGFELRLARVRL